MFAWFLRLMHIAADLDEYSEFMVLLHEEHVDQTQEPLHATDTEAGGIYIGWQEIERHVNDDGVQD